MEDIHDIRGPIEIFSIWNWVFISLTSLIILVVGFFLIKWIIKRSRKNHQETEATEFILPPYEQALNQLVEARKLMRPGMDKELSVELSNAIRIYLEREYTLPAPEKTTEEFLLEIRDGSTFYGKQLELLASFLEMCDLAKFAKYNFSPTDQGKLYKKAVDFLEHSHEQKMEDEKRVQKVKNA